MAKGKHEHWLTEDGLTLLEGWARDGLDQKQIAHNMGISLSTLKDYVKKYSAISTTLKKNKEIVDYEVENTLHKKCVGYMTKVERAIKCKKVFYDDNGKRCEEEEIKMVLEDFYVQPDTTAIAIWLNNRRPEAWRRNANKERLDEKKFKHDKEVADKKYF